MRDHLDQLAAVAAAEIGWVAVLADDGEAPVALTLGQGLTGPQ